MNEFHTTNLSPRTALPPCAGLGLKPEHFRAILATRPDLGFFEIHAENYMIDGGPFHHYLTAIRERFALSIHGVGLSIGGEAPLDRTHLARLKLLLDRYQPESFSEHLAWSSHGENFYNDLLPAPFTSTTLRQVCEHIDETQSMLGRAMLLENPATYIEFASSTWTEADFITEILHRTGCGLLLDVNNAYVSAVNHNRNAVAYIDALPLAAVGEIHLAGFAEDLDAAGARLLIDNHGAPIADAVWTLYRHTINRLGPVPTLIERDQNIPPFPVLLAEAHAAAQLMQNRNTSPRLTTLLECV